MSVWHEHFIWHKGFLHLWGKGCGNNIKGGMSRWQWKAPPPDELKAERMLGEAVDLFKAKIHSALGCDLDHWLHGKFCDLRVLEVKLEVEVFCKANVPFGNVLFFIMWPLTPHRLFCNLYDVDYLELDIIIWLSFSLSKRNTAWTYKWQMLWRHLLCPPAFVFCNGSGQIRSF